MKHAATKRNKPRGKVKKPEVDTKVQENGEER